MATKKQPDTEPEAPAAYVAPAGTHLDPTTNELVADDTDTDTADE